MFIPQAMGANHHDPLRNMFLRAAAALLGVPDLYQEIIAQLGLTIDPEHCKQTYDVAKFGNEHHLGINKVACFLAATGVDDVEAEKWQ
jgi:hypothetical protein